MTIGPDVSAAQFLERHVQRAVAAIMDVLDLKIVREIAARRGVERLMAIVAVVPAERSFESHSERITRENHRGVAEMDRLGYRRGSAMAAARRISKDPRQQEVIARRLQRLAKKRQFLFAPDESP